MRIELLATPNCPHARRAEDIVRAALSRDGREPSVDRIYIGDLDHAASLGFRGSPTIRIDGRDVVQANGLPINLGCRLYRQPDGSLDGVVPAEMLLAEVARREQEEAQQRAARAARPGLRDAP
ncbi:MAG TPA: hypothetical protein VK992_00710, partial [Candidatus Caenarcaniphilales bacterium]|nr:hypothetical protein [Candidatus Caenarcaniphilales bacterium]